MSNSRICHFKLVLLGDTAVGKSCLVVRFVRDEFFEFQEPTIGGVCSFLFFYSLRKTERERESKIVIDLVLHGMGQKPPR